jgi:hypothetical protein
MKNVYDVLRQKELDIQRVRKEITMIRVVIPLLTDDTDDVLELKPLGDSPLQGTAMRVTKDGQEYANHTPPWSS